MAEPRSTLSRRRFFAAAAKAGAVLAAPMFIPGTVLGKDGGVAASERIALAGIGIRNRGGYVLDCMMDEPVMQFVAIADVRKDCRENVKAKAETKYGRGVAAYRDFREMLPRDDIDAVLIATGDRWHTLASIYAAKAGKDIYCEKPCSMTIAESQALADTMQRYGRIYQAGTQRRSVANFIFATDLCRDGKTRQAHESPRQHAVSRHESRLAARQNPSRPGTRWIGTCGSARRLGGRTIGSTSTAVGASHFDFHGGGILEWGAHTVDLCNWAGSNDREMPVLYEPTP